MPVDGYKHKRVWQYRFRPQPYQVLDRGWHGHDRDWELGLVERLRRGEAAPRSLSIRDLVLDDWGWGQAQGWEAAEKHSKNAVRTGAAYLNHEAIARRLPERELREKAYAEQQARWEAEAPQREAAKAQRAAEEAKFLERLKAAAAERAEAERVWRKSQAERQRARAEHDAEWERTGANLRATQERIILANKWQCDRCKTVAKIEAQNDGYALSCSSCGSSTWGAHATLVGMLGR